MVQWPGADLTTFAKATVVRRSLGEAAGPLRAVRSADVVFFRAVARDRHPTPACTAFSHATP